MSFLLEKLRTAEKNLPPGHYDIAKAKSRLDEEYSLARDAERGLWKSLPKRIRKRYPVLEKSDILSCIRFVCYYFHIKRPKIFVSSLAARESGAAGLYSKNEIRFPYNFPVSTRVFLHELAHHVSVRENMGWGHGHDFIWCLETVYETFAEWAHTKKNAI